MQAYSVRPFEVLQWVRPNAYVIDVPPDPTASSTFNVEDLVAYIVHTALPFEPFKEPPLVPNTYPILNPIQPPLPPTHKRNIDAFLDEHVVFARDGVQHFLVRWRGQQDSDCTWITTNTLQKFDLELLEYYQSCQGLHSRGPSFSHLGRVGAGHYYTCLDPNIGGRPNL